jgi:hypothetical protein
MSLRSSTFVATASAMAAFNFVVPAHAGPLRTNVTINLAACDKPSGDETICTNDPFGIPDHTILGGTALAINFSLGNTAMAHLVAFSNVTWIFDLSFCCEEVEPDFTVTLSGRNGAIPGLEAIPPDNASACSLLGKCTFTVPIPGSTSIYGLNFTEGYRDNESVLSSLQINTEGSDHIATIPEPATGALVSLALAVAGFGRRKV